MEMDQPPADWLASGGAYTVIFGQTVISSIFFGFLAIRVGKAHGAEGDGCLLLIANIVLAILGSAIGFFSSPYPTFIYTSLAGTIALPGLATFVFANRIAKS